MSSQAGIGTAHGQPSARTVGWLLAAEGFASLSIEVMGLRRMVPYVGSPVPVTSVLLAAYLAALALGYHRGQKAAARLAARHSGARLQAALREAAGTRLATAAVGAALAIGELGPVSVFVPARMLGIPAVGVIVYSTLFIAPLGMLLAESILLLDRTQKDGKTTGTSFGISTAGNVIGALATAWFCLQVLGTAGTVALICGVLAAAAWTCWPKAMPIGAVVFLAGATAAWGWIDQELYLGRTAYADYQLVTPADDADARGLSNNGSYASRDDEAGVGHPYIEAMELALCESGARRIAVLGAAGRTFGRGAPCAMEEVVFVDIDAGQREAGDRMRFGPAAGPLVVADAREWLAGQQDQGRWDAIIADAYTHGSSLPRHLATREFFGTVRNALAPDGTALFNILRTPGAVRWRTRIDRTIRSVFSDCETLNMDTFEAGAARWLTAADTKRSQIVYGCRRQPHDGERTIYSDVLERIDYDRPLD